MESDRPSFGERIRQLRKAKGLTQRELGDVVGVDFSYLSKIENDNLEHTPSVRTLVKLAEALDVDELELMNLANKVPAVMSTIARYPEALRFLRRAAKEIDDASGWEELSQFLDEKAVQQRKRGRRT
jgi:transcriptional regulator with XRE-family HTH domain